MSVPESPPATAPPQNIAGKKTHLFVSYSRSDRLAIDRLVNDLRDHHYTLWMDVDERGIEPGEDWREELVRQMSAAEGVLACISPDFLTSQYCREEIQQARNEKKPIFPVVIRRLGATDKLDDFGLGHLQYIDLAYGEQAYELGLKRLRTVLPRPAFPLNYYAGRLLKAALAVFGVIGVFLLGMWIMWRLIIAFLPPPNVADKDIGVAVAQFAIPNDGSVSQADADVVTQRFSSLLNQELTASFAPLRLTLGFLGPNVIGQVSNNPEAIAQKYGAKIVVYGDIIKNSRGQLEITPRFYVDPNAFADAAEITGSSKLGSTLEVNAPPNTLTIQQTLSSRTTALAYVIVGLSKYVSQDYAGAQDAFNSALSQPDLDVENGGQAVRVLLGSTYKKLASLAAQRGDINTASAQLEQAIAEYQTVQEQTPEYARAYVGLAAATDLKWNLARQQDAETPNDLLEQALTYLDEAERSSDQPHFIFQMRARYTQMQIEYHLWAYYPANADDDLQTDIQRLANLIIDAYDRGRNPALQDIAAEAYGYRGLVFFGFGDCAKAIPEYEQARNITTENERIMTFSEWLGDCYTETGQNESAIDAYTRAHDLAQSIEGIDPSIVAYYEGKIAELSGRG